MWWCFDSLNACRVGGNAHHGSTDGGPDFFGFGLEKKWRIFFTKRTAKKCEAQRIFLEKLHFFVGEVHGKKTDWLGQIDWKKRLTGMENHLEKNGSTLGPSKSCMLLSKAGTNFNQWSFVVRYCAGCSILGILNVYIHVCKQCFWV